MRVVFDANVIAAGVCWNGEGYVCLVKIARRQVSAFGTEQTLAETREVCVRLIGRKSPRHHASTRLTWYLERVRVVEAAPLGKRRSRDPKDDVYLAAALGAKADALVTYDRDLFSLGKPFGVQILTPAQLLKGIGG